MQLLLLGGYSARNKAWIHEVAEVLAPLADQCVVHEYAHWDNEGQEMDFEAELAAVAAKAKPLDNYVLFAKSIGIILSVAGINRGMLAPRACVFAGLPLSAAKDYQNGGFAQQLGKVQRPVTFIQNNNDPLGSFTEVRAYLEHAGIATGNLKSLPGDTHSYDDFVQLKAFVQTALSAS